MTDEKARILVVDDEADVITYLKTLLEAAGYRVRTAATVDEGMKAMEEFSPNLLCLDIMMPQKTGITMYLDLKRHPEWRNVPVAIVSGVGQNNQFDFHSYVPDESVPPPAVYVEKPIVVEKFLNTVAQLLERPAGRQPR